MSIYLNLSKLLIHSKKYWNQAKFSTLPIQLYRSPIFAFYGSREISRNQKTIMNNTEFPKALRRRLNTYWYELNDKLYPYSWCTFNLKFHNCNIFFHSSILSMNIVNKSCNGFECWWNFQLSLICLFSLSCSWQISFFHVMNAYSLWIPKV